MTLSQIAPYLNGAAALFSLIAGGLWLVSASQSTPSDFTEVEVAIAEGGLTDETGALGPQKVYVNTKPLVDLANAIRQQSRYSAVAALFAFFAAICQAGVLLAGCS
jgi:hypothetical protein